LFAPAGGRQGNPSGAGVRPALTAAGTAAALRAEGNRERAAKGILGGVVGPAWRGAGKRGHA